MFNSHLLFKQRLSEHIKELSRYFRYIFNGHIAFAMLFFISAGAVYYRKWLDMLHEDFPTALVIGIAFGLIVSRSPIRTLLREPDLVFLLPAEDKMKPYFRNAIIYSFIVQLYIVFLAGAVFGPLYFASFPERTGSAYLGTLCVLFILKAANLLANWWILKIREPGVRIMDIMVRTFMNVLIFYFLINGEVIWAIAVAALFGFIFLYDLFISRRQFDIVWDLLVEKDQKNMQTFYRIANMFTDVPHLKNQIKKRAWLVILIKRVPFKQQYMFDYLYRISFVRSGEYLGIYVRLIIIGGLLIYFIPNIWMKLIFALLFLYLSSFQLITLYHQHRAIIWLDLYPVSIKLREQSFIKLIFQLTFIQTLIFALVFLGMQNWLGLLLILIGGTVFNFLFIYGYVKKKIIP